MQVVGVTMNRLHLLLFAFAFVFLNPVEGKGTCDWADTACTTKGANNAFKVFVAGVPGIVQPSDPMFIEELKKDLGDMKYHLSYVTLTGLRNCQLVRLTMNDEKLTYQNDFFCSELVVTYNHEIVGLIDLVEIDAKGATAITLRDYKIIFKGKYGKFISEKDQKLHLNIESHRAEFDTKKEMIINITGPLHPDKSKAEIAKAYVTENVKEMKKDLITIVVERFIGIFVWNIDTYIRNVPAEKIFPSLF